MIQLNRTTIWKDFSQYISTYMALKICSLNYFEQCNLVPSFSTSKKKILTRLNHVIPGQAVGTVPINIELARQIRFHKIRKHSVALEVCLSIYSVQRNEIIRFNPFSPGLFLHK